MHLYIVYLYGIIGFAMIFLDWNLPSWYISIVLFFTFKWIFDYRKCTISYIECLMRGVKKEQGYLYNFLNGIVDLRFSNHITLYYILVGFILVYHYLYKSNPLIPHELK